MRFEQYLVTISEQLGMEDGEGLANCLSRFGTHAEALYANLLSKTREGLNGRYLGKFASPWDEICIAHCLVIVNMKDGNMYSAYSEQATLANAFMRVFIQKGGWTLPTLYKLLYELRELAALGDLELDSQGKALTCCEDAARLCNKAFTSCVTDRTSPIDVSRKWGIYQVIGMVLKCYFKVNRINLCKNVIRAVDANKDDIPPITAYPISAQVTYRYYMGVLAFLQEAYKKAETELTFAFDNCHHGSPRNQERILTWLVPLRLLLKGSRPSPVLLERYPSIDGLYGPFIRAIMQGDIVAFDEALQALESRLVQLNVWIIILRMREIALRGVFRKVWKAQGSGTRVTIQAFHAGLKLAGQEMDTDEAECLVANSIYKGFMKGYISHEAQTVVLAKNDPFPRLADRVLPVGLQS